MTRTSCHVMVIGILFVMDCAIADLNGFLDFRTQREDCSDHGGMSGYTCKCDKGWTGEFCQTKIGYDCRYPCDGQKAYNRDCSEKELVATKGGCYKHGSCNQHSGDCACNLGWTGIKCNQAYHCEESPDKCHEHGVCDTNDGTCSCTEGGKWFGKDCNERCIHGHVENNICKCDSYFEGDDCSKMICRNGNVRHGTYCDCHDGWTGPTCNKKLHCSKTHTISGYSKCDCEAGWKGEHCDVKCDHGHVEEKGGVSLCICDQGYSGHGCTIENRCSEDCGHGVCRLIGETSYECECDQPWSPTIVDDKVQKCDVCPFRIDPKTGECIVFNGADVSLSDASSINLMAGKGTSSKGDAIFTLDKAPIQLQATLIGMGAKATLSVETVNKGKMSTGSALDKLEQFIMRLKRLIEYFKRILKFKL